MSEKKATNEDKYERLLKYSLLAGGLGTIYGVSRAISKKQPVARSAMIAGVNFFFATGTFIGIKEGAEYLRKKDDVYNYLISGAFIGTALSPSMPSNGAKIISIVSFTTLGGIIYGIPFFLKNVGQSVESRSLPNAISLKYEEQKKVNNNNLIKSKSDNRNVGK